MLSTTAWDPAPVVARSVCTRWWSSACWCGGEPAWNWLLPCMKGLMCDTHTSTSSFNTSQRRLCSLSIAAACQKSFHTSRLLPSGAKSWQMMCWYFTSSRAVWAQSECNMFQASIQELRTETCRLVLPFLATWPTSNPSFNRGRSWSTEP